MLRKTSKQVYLANQKVLDLPDKPHFCKILSIKDKVNRERHKSQNNFLKIRTNTRMANMYMAVFTLES